MKQHCCAQMERYLNDKRVPLNYDEILREYSLYLFHSQATQLLIYCPWCGTKLPESLREEYCDILENEYQVEVCIFDIKTDSPIPIEFKSDEWWKKRNL